MNHPESFQLATSWKEKLHTLYFFWYFQEQQSQVFFSCPQLLFLQIVIANDKRQSKQGTQHCYPVKMCFYRSFPFSQRIDRHSSLGLRADFTRKQMSKIRLLIYIKTIATYTSLNVSRFKWSQNMILINGSFFRSDFFLIIDGHDTRVEIDLGLIFRMIWFVGTRSKSEDEIQFTMY